MPTPGGVTQVTAQEFAALRYVVSRPTSQTYRPTIVFTNGYPDAAATVQDVRDRVARLRDSIGGGAGSYGALLEAETELRDLGVTQ